MFIAALFTVAKNWKQLSSPTTADWISWGMLTDVIGYGRVREESTDPRRNINWMTTIRYRSIQGA